MEGLSNSEARQLYNDVREIKTALLGMPVHKIEGIVDKVERHDKYIQKSKLRAATFTGIASGIGLGIHQLIEFFNKH